MPNIPYRPDSFGTYMGPLLSSEGTISVTWSELARAAITVGRRNWNDVLLHGTYSYLEVLWRLAMLRSNLVEGDDGRLHKSSAYTNLDPSEKSAVSFFIGNTIAKLVSEKLFGVGWLLHLDTYQNSINPTPAFNKRPDFVGLDSSMQWIVVEAKGRTGAATSALMKYAKKQTRCLRRINGEYPSLRIAIASYFPSTSLRTWICDPDVSDKDAEDLPLEPEALAHAYYQLIIELIHSSDSREEEGPFGGAFRFVSLPGFNARIGVEEDICQWLESPRFTWQAFLERREVYPSILAAISAARTLEEDLPPEMIEQDSRLWPLHDAERTYRESIVGIDGITVELGESWNPEVMRTEPSRREQY